jgi:hypothetical protein
MQTEGAEGTSDISTTVVCPRCGSANPVGPIFCAKCAGRLTSAPHSNSMSGTQSSPAKPWYECRLTSYSTVQRRGIERTQNGLLLLIIGLVLAPVLSSILNAVYIANIFMIAGVIMIILGREVFGHRHSRLVLRAANIYVFGFVAGIFNTALFVLSLPGSSLVSALDAFEIFIVGSIILSAVVGVAILLLTYALQNHVGRMLLWAALSSLIALQALMFYVVEGELARGVSDFFYIESQLQSLSLLGIVPAVINAIALYRVRARIQTGELTKNL